MGSLGASGPRVGSDFTLTLFQSPSTQSTSFILSFVPTHRESEAHPEREVKVGPLVCKDPKVVQVHQDQMVQRYGGIYHHCLCTWVMVMMMMVMMFWSSVLGQSRSNWFCWRAWSSRTSGNARRERHTWTIRPQRQHSKNLAKKKRAAACGLWFLK